MRGSAFDWLRVPPRPRERGARGWLILGAIAALGPVLALVDASSGASLRADAIFILIPECIVAGWTMGLFVGIGFWAGTSVLVAFLTTHWPGPMPEALSYVTAFLAALGSGLLRRSRDAQEESEERFRLLTQASLEGILIHEQARVI